MLEQFSVRGDGCTSVTLSSAEGDAVIAYASSPSFVGTAIVAKAGASSSDGFYLLKVLRGEACIHFASGKK
jgi:hypothetical protein